MCYSMYRHSTGLYLHCRNEMLPICLYYFPMSGTNHHIHTCLYILQCLQPKTRYIEEFCFPVILYRMNTFSAGMGCSTVLGFMLLRDSLLGWGMIGGPNLSFTDRWSCCWSSAPSDFSWKTYSKYTNKIKPQSLQCNKM